MNLLFRLLHILIFSRYRNSLSLLDRCRTPFRVWFTDLDILRHMNNGIYFSLQDLARTDFMIRAKTKSIMDQNGWYPVVVGETLTFKKSLQPFTKFEIETKVLGWDEKHFFLEHRFVSGEILYAFGYVRARFLRKTGGSVSPVDVLAAAKLPGDSPKLDRKVLSWFEATAS